MRKGKYDWELIVWLVGCFSSSLQEISSILLELKRVEKQLQGKDTHPSNNHMVPKLETLEQAAVHSHGCLMRHHFICLFVFHDRGEHEF